MSLVGRRVLVAGKLVSMPRRDAEQIIRQHGGELVERARDTVDLVVIADDADLKKIGGNAQLGEDPLRERVTAGDVELIRESALWTRLGLVESGHGIERLYTAAMLAEL